MYNDPIATYPTFEDLPLNEHVIEKPVLKSKKKKKPRRKNRPKKPDLVFLNPEAEPYPDPVKEYNPEPYVEDKPFLKPFAEEPLYHDPYFKENIYPDPYKQSHPEQIMKPHHSPEQYKPFEEHYRPYKQPNYETYDEPSYGNPYEEPSYPEANPYPGKDHDHESYTYPEHDSYTDNKPKPKPYYPKHNFKDPDLYYNPEHGYKEPEPAIPGYGYRTPKEYYNPPTSKLIPEINSVLKDPNWNVKDFKPWQDELKTKNYGGSLVHPHTGDQGSHHSGAYNPFTDPYNPFTDPYNVHYNDKPGGEDYNNKYETYYQTYPQDYSRHKPIVYQTPKPFDISFEDWLDTSGVEAFGLPSDEVNHYEYVPESYDFIGHRNLKTQEAYDKPLYNVATSPYENFKPTESYYKLQDSKSYQYEHKVQV